MNTVANNVASKLFVAFVAVAMLFTLATPAKAATEAELQKMINDLMAQVASLQGQMGSTGGSVASGVCPFTWTRTLTTGATGADVMKLQQFLNASADTRVSASGVGSVGMETEYYGPATAAAVSNFQMKYRSDILSPAGLVNPTGSFGPATMAKANALCASAPVVDDSDDSDDTSDDSDDDSSSSDLSGEASLDTFEVADGEDADDVEEGSEDVQIAEFTVEFSDGDAMITRLDLALVGSGNTESDPWDIFNEVSLWVDGDEVARMDASDEDEYLDEDDGSLRFSGLDIVAMEDEEVVVVVGASITSSVDDAGDSSLADWDVTADAIRFVDADDVTTTDDSTGDLGGAAAAEFTIDEAGAGDDLDLESSDEDPDSTTLELDEDDNTEYAIFAFDLSAEDSDGDIDLNEVIVGVNVSTSTLDTLVNDFRLEIGGDSFDAESYTGTGLTGTLVFDIDGDVTVAADDVVTAMLYADFENMEAYEGATIYATTTAAGIDAEGEDDVSVDGSTVTGETHTLRTEGVSVEYVEDDVTADENNDATTTDNAADFELQFSVTSFGDDIYLPFGATSSSTLLTDGVHYSIIDTNTNSVVTTGTHIASLDMDDDGETNSFKVSDGDSQTFTLTVNYDPATAGSYKLRLDTINFALTDVSTATSEQDVSDEDVDTTQITISQ